MTIRRRVAAKWGACRSPKKELLSTAVRSKGGRARRMDQRQVDSCAGREQEQQEGYPPGGAPE
jgi:hypothetical protein